MKNFRNPVSVLLVEDDSSLRHSLLQRLELEGHKVITAVSVSESQRILRVAIENKQLPDIVLLDLGLPDGNGISIVESLRKLSQIPIIVISAAGSEEKKVELLDSGADDFLAKPFGHAELLARIRAALRHRGVDVPAAITQYRQGQVKIDLTLRHVDVGGEIVHLTPTEFELLAVLVRAGGRVVTQRQLLLEVWGAEFIDHSHYLRLYTAQIRRKIEDNPAEPRLLLTEIGVGYRLFLTE